jgi:hypothetical protein
VKERRPVQKLVREDTERVFTVPWLVGRDEGLFAREGYEIEIVPGQLHGIGAIAQAPETPSFIADPEQVDSNWMHRLFLDRQVDIFCA